MNTVYPFYLLGCVVSLGGVVLFLLIPKGRLSEIPHLKTSLFLLVTGAVLTAGIPMVYSLISVWASYRGVKPL